MAIIELPWLLEHATYGLMFLLLLVAGLGLPMPEDIVLLAAGALIEREVTRLVPTSAVIVVGVLVGDMMIFMMARHLGTRALERPLFRRLLPRHRRDRLERLFERWGGGIVFMARHLAGIRAPVFALAGMHGMNPFKFLFFDLAGLAVSAPVIMGLGYFFSDRLDDAMHHMAQMQHWVIFAVVGLLSVYATYAALRRWVRHRQRRS